MGSDVEVSEVRQGIILENDLKSRACVCIMAHVLFKNLIQM